MKVEIPDYLLAQLIETEDAIAEFIKAPAANYPIEELSKAISRRDTLAIVITEHARQAYEEKIKAG